MGSIESNLSLLSKENRSPVPAMLLSGHRSHLNRLSIPFQLMKFVWFFFFSGANFSRGVFPFFPVGSRACARSLAGSLPPSWQLSLFPDDGCLPAYAKKTPTKPNILWSKFSVPCTAGAVEEGNLPAHSGWAQRRTGRVLLKWTRMEVAPPGPGVKLGGRDALQARWVPPCGHSDLYAMAMGCGFSSSLHIPHQPRVPPQALGSPAGRSSVVLPAREGTDLQKAATLGNISEAPFSS